MRLPYSRPTASVLGKARRRAWLRVATPPHQALRRGGRWAKVLRCSRPWRPQPLEDHQGPRGIPACPMAAARWPGQRRRRRRWQASLASLGTTTWLIAPCRRQALPAARRLLLHTVRGRASVTRPRRRAGPCPCSRLRTAGGRSLEGHCTAWGAPLACQHLAPLAVAPHCRPSRATGFARGPVRPHRRAHARSLAAAALRAASPEATQRRPCHEQHRCHSGGAVCGHRSCPSRRRGEI